MNDDDDNPMHRIGYGRGDDHPHVQVMPIRVLGEKKLEPTQPMEATETLTVKDIIHRLVERNLQAWRALPESVRDKMLECPQLFQLPPNKKYSSSNKECFDYDIQYRGTIWRYNGASIAWVIQDITI